MFEIDGVPPELAREALTLGAAKLPIKTQVRRPDRRRVMAQTKATRCAREDAGRAERRMLLDLRKEQFNLRFQRATGQQEGVGRVRAGAARDRAGEDHHGGEDSAPPRRQS